MALAILIWPAFGVIALVAGAAAVHGAPIAIRYVPVGASITEVADGAVVASASSGGGFAVGAGSIGGVVWSWC